MINLEIIVISIISQLVSSATTISKPANIQAKNLILYSSSTAMANTIFTTSFSLAGQSSNPTFCYGINNYKSTSSFASQYFISSLFSMTPSIFAIQVVSNNTLIQTFSISYLAVWNESNIYVSQHNVTNAANISAGSGNRYYQVWITGNFPSMLVTVVPLLKGFYITSGAVAVYSVQISLSIVSTQNYLIYISTVSQCLIKYISFDILFFNEGILTSQDYMVAGDQTTYSSTLNNVNSYNRYVSNYSKTAFLLALRGFYGFTSISSTAVFGWSLLNVTNDIATISISLTSLQAVYYSYFQIGLTKTVTVPTVEQSPGSTNFIGIIGGIIGGVVVLAIGIYVGTKFYFKSKLFNVPVMGNIRELPSLSI